MVDERRGRRKGGLVDERNVVESSVAWERG